ncbi:nucleotidyltransferase, partial [Lacticaseibacillus paracasei subsp. paracasei Lpp41]
MQTVGMIAEFNPFHTGHAYALALSAKAGASRCCRCRDVWYYVQRGEP